MIILDVGEGTVLRTASDVDAVIAAIARSVDETGFPREQLIAKPQLFTWEPPNRPINPSRFRYLFEKCHRYGMPCTASVFDKSSVDHLLKYSPLPFVKIANRSYLRRLAILVPRGVPVYASYSMDPADETEYDKYVDYWMACVSNYPAEAGDYDRFRLSPNVRPLGISDHTIGLDLYRKYRPDIYEKHFGLKGAKGPSLGPWSIDEDGLVELLRLAKDVPDDGLFDGPGGNWSGIQEIETRKDDK